MCFWFFKGKERAILPRQQRPSEGQGVGSNPWAEFNFCSKNSQFCLNPGRTKGDNSDRYKFPSEALSAKLLSFPSYSGDTKIPGGYLQPNMKAPFYFFFFEQRKIIWFLFFFFLLFFMRCPKNVPSFRPHAKPLLFTCIPRRGLTKPSITQQHLGSGTKSLQSWKDLKYMRIYGKGLRRCHQLKASLTSTLILLNRVMQINFAVSSGVWVGSYLGLGNDNWIRCSTAANKWPTLKNTLILSLDPFSAWKASHQVLTSATSWQ